MTSGLSGLSFPRPLTSQGPDVRTIGHARILGHSAAIWTLDVTRPFGRAKTSIPVEQRLTRLHSSAARVSGAAASPGPEACRHLRDTGTPPGQLPCVPGFRVLPHLDPCETVPAMRLPLPSRPNAKTTPSPTVMLRAISNDEAKERRVLIVVFSTGTLRSRVRRPATSSGP